MEFDTCISKTKVTHCRCNTPLEYWPYCVTGPKLAQDGLDHPTILAPMMEAASTSETSIYVYRLHGATSQKIVFLISHSSHVRNAIRG
jgi:hypothetical protein